MQKSIAKFISYLKEERQKIVKEIGQYYDIMSYICLSKKITQNVEEFANSKTVDHFLDTNLAERFIMLEKYVNFLFKNIDSWVDQNITISDYGEISLLLKESDLNMREKVEVLVYLLNQFFQKLPFSPILLNYENVKDQNNSIMSEEQFKQFYYSGEIAVFMNSKDEGLTEDQIQFKNKLWDCIVETEESKRFRTAIINLKKHFLNKNSDFNEKDLKIVLKSLEVLNVHEEIRNGFENIYQKKIMKKQQLNKCVFQPLKAETPLFSLNEKQTKLLYREINTYYDIDNQKSIRPLQLNEIVYLVSLLYRANIKDHDIEICLRNISKSFVGSYPNSFAKFNDYYEKMVYYSSDQDIAVALNYLKDCLPFLFIPQNKKEYFEWKKEFSQILEEVLQKLKLNYEYEMKAGKELAMKLYNK